jgi:threonine/homoserine/homoserine lactone efflux protein
MAVSSIAAFWAVAALLIAVPGADWAFVIGAAVRNRAVMPAVGGLILGYSGITMAVAAGVGAAVGGSTAILTGLTLVGGVYLVWHGAMTFTHPAHVLAPPGPAPALELYAASGPSAIHPASAESRSRLLLQGIGVSGLNPKGLLIFLALLPQFTDRHGHLPLAAQMAVLGLVFILTCAAFYLVLGTLVRTTLYARPGFAPKISQLAGIAMVVIGLLLIVQRLAGRA